MWKIKGKDSRKKECQESTEDTIRVEGGRSGGERKVLGSEDDQIMFLCIYKYATMKLNILYKYTPTKRITINAI